LTTELSLIKLYRNIRSNNLCSHMISHEVHLLMGSLLYLHSDYTDKTIHCFWICFRCLFIVIW